MSRSSSSALRKISIIFCIVLSAVTAHAQYRTSIQGVVTDATGAVIPGAKLTLTNPATSQKQERVSDDAGVFNFNALAAAKFRLEVEKDGFQKKIIDNITLIPEQPNALNVQLDVGAASTSVNVDASATPLLDTETASVNGVVTENQIQHMPSFGRDVFQLIQLAPGVFGVGAQGGGGASCGRVRPQLNAGHPAEASPFRMSGPPLCARAETIRAARRPPSKTPSERPISLPTACGRSCRPVRRPGNRPAGRLRR